MVANTGRAALAKKEALNQKRLQKRKQLEQKIESWFHQFDVDQDGCLDRDELRKLLVHLHPPPIEPPPLEQLDGDAT